MKFLPACLIAASLMGAIAPVAAQDMSAVPRRPTLTVTGEGTASGVPDMASFSSAVVSEAKTAREALDANSAAVAQMIAAIKGAGVEARDVATSGFSIQPQYAPPKKDSNEAPRITGYEVRNTVSVRLRELARLGELLDQVVTSGANQIGGIAFDIADPSALEDKARVAAVEDARHRAEIMAAAAGQRLVRVLAVSADGAIPPMPRMVASTMMMKADSVPVEAGETEVRANVTLVYEIEPR
ncbi:SIMPL domain-containing protein [Ancylobacter pratisalsi]|uniref:SIMPL domain-containing protein n=1 Tax=Ancylobacter pratisalsi TaxID=1745854 RepID=A0A6P1YH46_9HYPH|nr:SIMPL domain-containing protein [Ancylobacter pratisalsi]QIB32618.1 SIMPL domain-containing protein [Ancylobacter pratisalsi]